MPRIAARGSAASALGVLKVRIEQGIGRAAVQESVGCANGQAAEVVFGSKAGGGIDRNLRGVSRIGYALVGPDEMRRCGKSHAVRGGFQLAADHVETAEIYGEAE